MGSLPPPYPNPELLPTLITARATATPDRVFAITPRSNTDLEQGWAPTTYGQVKRAIDRLAWWLDATLGPARKGVFETFGYVGPPDLRYSFVVVAAQVVGRKVLLPLSQNSFEAHLNLVKKTDAKTLIGAGNGLALWERVKEHQHDVRIIEMLELEELLSDEPVEHYPFTKTWEENKDDPIHINHTSGTTGLPKPVETANAWSVHLVRDMALAEAGRPLAFSHLAKRTVLVFMPPEWLLGLFLQLHMPVYMDVTPVLMPSGATRPLTADFVDRVHQLAPAGVDSGFYVPDLLKQLVKTPEHIAHMRALPLHTIFFGGAALDKHAGDTLAAFATVQPFMGATETGPFPLLASPPHDVDGGDWDWYGLDPTHYSGVRMRPYADGLYEMVIERLPGQEDAQMIFRLFPELADTYHTKDLFSEHPSKKDRWRCAGRTDDFVKLANMTKFSAGHVESLLDRHPLVRDSVVGGDGRKRPFVLVQLKEDAAGGGVLDEIWPVFEEANGHIADDIQLRKEMVLFATPDKPFRKAGKGTINRRLTLADYEDEIRRMYERVGGEA